MQPIADEGKIKQLMKEALIEALQEQKSVFYELIVEAIEDIGLTNAIREGANTEVATKQEVFDILEGRA